MPCQYLVQPRMYTPKCSSTLCNKTNKDKHNKEINTHAFSCIHNRCPSNQADIVLRLHGHWYRVYCTLSSNLFINLHYVTVITLYGHYHILSGVTHSSNIDFIVSFNRVHYFNCSNHFPRSGMNEAANSNLLCVFKMDCLIKHTL